MTIPQKNVPDLPAGVLDGAAPTARSSSTPATTTRSSATAGSPPIEEGTPESVWVSEQLGRPVVKAFNGIYAEHLLSGGTPRGRPRAPRAARGGRRRGRQGRRRRACSTSSASTASTPGRSPTSWRQQPGTPVYGASAGADAIRDLLAQASPERTPEWTA